MARHEDREDREQFTLVTLDELAPQIGGSPAGVRVVAEQAGVRIYVTWKDEPAVTAADARRLRMQYLARRAERDTREAAYVAWKERREAEQTVKLDEDARRRREAQERELQRAREADREEMQARHAREAAARVAERARFEPDTSRDAFEKETRGV